VDWAHAFTAFEADPEKANQKDHSAASAYVAGCVKKHLDYAVIKAGLEQGRRRASSGAEILCMGSGWGALEGRRPNGHTPAGLSFPGESVSEAEAPWAELLANGTLPMRPPEAGPGSFVADKNWEALLESSPGREGDWLTPYHLGVISFESGDGEKAVAYWKESVSRRENPWAYRNLAQASIRAGDIPDGLEYYRRALSLPGSEDRSFLEEYVPLLLDAGKEDEANETLKAHIQKIASLEALSIPLINAAARIALTRGDDALLDRVFSVEQAHIREGNSSLVDIWMEREQRRIAGGKLSKEQAKEQLEKALANGSLVIPAEIDFRMYAPAARSTENGTI